MSSLTHLVEFAAQFDVLLGVGESHFATIALIVGQTAKGVVVLEAEIAVVDGFESLDRHVVVAHHIGFGQNGAFDILGKFFARDNFNV